MTVVLRIGKQGPPGPQGPAGTPGTSGILTTKGDLLARDASTEVRLPIGTDGQRLEADSLAALGLKWSTPAASTPLTTKGDVLSHDGLTLKRVPVGGDGDVLTANAAAADGVDYQTPTTLAHGLGSASHTDTTIAGLNALLSDGPIDAASASRTPLSHAIGGAEHSSSSLAAFNALISGGNLDFDSAERTAAIHGLGDLGRHSSTDIAGLNALLTDGPIDAAGTPRPPTAHALDAHTAISLPELNALITSGSLDLVGTPRPPLAHALGAHTPDSLASLNAALTDGPVDVATASRPPSGAAGGDLSGSFPSPTVNDGADSTAVHVNIASEIAGLTLKATPAAGDHVMLEQLSDGAKRRSPFSAFASAGPPAVHDIGGAEHSISTLAAFNAKISGGNLDFDTDARPPDNHLFGTAHTPDTLANVNANIIGGSVDFDTASRPPTVHAFAGADHSASSLGDVNSKISGGSIDFDTGTRPPTTHAFAGAAHSSSSLAEVNALISGGSIDFDTAPRPPTAHTHAHDDTTGINENNHHNRAHSITSLGDHSFPGGGTQFLRDDGVFATVGGGAHAIGGALHTASSLADFNTKISGLDVAALAGQLGGTPESPDVRGLRTTSGGGTLHAYGDIEEGEVLTLVSGDIIGTTKGAGAGSASGLEYLFSTTTTAGNPGAGTVRFNAVTYVGTTAIFINDIADRPNFDIGVGLAALVPGDLFSFAEDGDDTSAVIYTVTSVAVDNGGWWTVAVAHQQNAGGDLINNSARVFVGTFLKADHHQNNTVAVVNPVAGDDNTLGYTVKSEWVNVDTDEAFIAVDVSTGAAVWKRTTVEASVSGGVTAEYRFDTTLTPGPSNGRFRTNNAVFASVTELYLNDSPTSPTWDHGAIFGLMVDGDLIAISEDGDGASSAIYRVTSATDNTGDWTFVVTPVANGGGDNFTNNARCTFAFVRLTVRHNPDAVVDPTTDDDVDLLYGPLSHWVNAVSDRAFINVDGTDGAAVWKLITGGASTEEWTYADDMTVPVTADWAINEVSPLSEDSINSAIHALMFDDTTEEGGGLMRTVPTGAIRMIFKTLAKPDSAPPGAETAVFHLRFREIQDGAAVGAWGTPVDLTNIDFTADVFHRKDVTDNDLATWGVVVGKTYQLLLSRDVADGSESLDDDCGIVGVGTEWIY